MTVLDFYFDYLSPYAYLASLDIGELSERHGVELRMRPVLFAGLLEHWGQRGPAEIRPKGRHAFRECARHALVRGVPLRSPRYHPFRPLVALRVSLETVSGADQRRVIGTLMELGWARGGDLGGAGEIAGALDRVGLDGAALVARTEEPAMKQLLRSETEAAVARGVFGIPTMLVGDELFWGLDQLRWIELYLEGKDPLASVDLESLLSEGRAAWRKGVPRPE
jgi:2-hydroxychromene-2-carboxylate isomerase